jgi:hypothetical protein
MIAVLVLSTSVVAHRGKVTTDNYLAPAGKNRTKPRPSNAPAVQDFGNVPAIFEANRGQARKEVKFLARGNGYTMFLTSAGMQLALDRPINRDAQPGRSSASGQQLERHSFATLLHMKLIGSSRATRIEPLEPLPGTVNYFVGSSRKNWATRIQTFGSILYKEVYPGIDAVFHGNAGRIEYDFVLSPSADPTKIRLQFSGAREIKLDANGDLLLYTASGEVRNRKPTIYQEIGGQRREVSGHYVLRDNNGVSFSVANYARNERLVIDPAIVYSTYLNGTAAQSNPNSWASSVAVFTDPVTGHVYAYAAGHTSAIDFPVVNAVQSYFGGPVGDLYAHGDAFVTKFDPAASGAASVVWSTYLGGSGTDVATGIAVDSVGNVFVTGGTGSPDFPTANAYQSSIKYGYNPDCLCGPVAGDAFVAKLSADGSTLSYSSFFGGSGNDSANAIALDSAGWAYIAGTTNSADLPTVNPYQSGLPPIPTPDHGVQSALMAIFDTTRSGSASLLYSTYLGGGQNQQDSVAALAVDSSGCVHLGGNIGANRSPAIISFPILNGFQGTPTSGHGGTGAAFYAKLNPAAIGPAQLIYSTFLGGGSTCPQCGQGSDGVTGIALDSSGNAYVYGLDFSGQIPTTPGAYQTVPAPNSVAAFIAKINPSLVGLASLIYSTLLPGLDVQGGGIAVDANGDAFVTGSMSTGLPLVNAVQNSSNGVFQSVDAGASWTVLSQGLTEFPVTALALDTSTSPRTLYAATGGGGNATGSIFASSDGGLSWNKIFQVPGGQSQTPAAFALALDPTIPSHVYAGTTAGVFASSDRGATWSAVNTGLSPTAAELIEALVFDGGTLYAGALDGLYRLSSGASTWTHTDEIVEAENIVVDPTTTPHTLYTAKFGIGAYKSVDGGTTWASFNPNNVDAVSNIVIDPTSTPASIYTWSEFNSECFLYKSTDGGNSWTTLWEEGVEVPARIALDTSVSVPIIYLLVPDARLSVKSTDGGANWQDVSYLVGGSLALALDPTRASPTSPAPVYTATNRTPSTSAFVAELNPTGSTLLFSTYLGGIHGDTFGAAIALDNASNIYVAGSTSSNHFPTVNAHQTAPSQSGFPSAFLVKLGSQPLPQNSSGNVSTQVAVQTGTLAITLPNITGSTTGTQPTLTVTPLSSIATANFSLSSNLGAYDISTTATFNASPSNPVTLCFQALTVNDPSTFSGLQIMHIVNGVPQNITTSHDFGTRTICGAVTSLSPFVLVKGAVGQINDLIRLVNESDIRHGIQTSLDAKLQNAVSAFSAARNNSYTTVCNQMSAFINNVQAQAGLSISPTEAGAFISAAKQIKTTLGCTP